MKAHWGGLALAILASGCVVTEDISDPWDPAQMRAALGIAAEDPWCVHMGSLRASLDGAGPAPDEAMRESALNAVRAEAEAEKGGDPLWPFRKALICEFTQGAGEERQEYDWRSARDFLEEARMAATNLPPEDGISPLVPVYDHLDGEEPESLAPVDLTEPGYCDSLETSDRALSQLRGDTVAAVGFPGSLRRAPDWFAEVQVSYNRWAREQVEGPANMGRISFHCRRFFNALQGSKAFSLKDNLIFLLPERDDPDKSGRLVVQDAEGKEIVLDRVLAAAQLDPGGKDGEPVDFYEEDLAAAPGLSSAVQRSNDLPPPRIFQIYFDYNSRTPAAGDPQIERLRAELASRDPAEPLRVAIRGHADCVGPRWYNVTISEDRAKAVRDEVVFPTLLANGFSEETLKDKKLFRLDGVGETVPAVEPARRCEPEDKNRRVVVVVQ